MISTVLFDLDGTLVHSAPGILAGFRKVLAEAGVTPIEPIDQRVIGPPLRLTLTRLTGIEDLERLEPLAAAFRRTYDADGVLDADPYPGLASVLSALATAERRLFIVTNKRLVPTRLLVDRLGIASRFAALYSLDMMPDRTARKRDVVARVLREHGIAPATTVLVGDSADDADAAQANKVRFIAVTYGYGAPLDVAGVAPAAVLDRLADLPGVLGSLD
ncbi:MAG: HAD family hydrolase [Gemmatimonadetes bacterium]|nr:HAD family hydrolase [Gemmatimonadota bacterium]